MKTNNLNFSRTRDLLYDFNFADVFIEELGWDQPSTTKISSLEIADQIFSYHRIAEAEKVVILEINANNGQIPDPKIRTEIYEHLQGIFAENLLIFVDQNRTRSLWYWVKHEGKKTYIRDHLYIKGQPGDLFLSKLASLMIDISELTSEISVVDIAKKLKDGFDIERVTKKFYQEFQQQHLEFFKFIQGIDSEKDQLWYTSVLLNRLMFVYFLQRKGFIDHGNLNYLQDKLQESKKRGENLYYSEFLKTLFFQGFGKLDHDEVIPVIGHVKYLNGGLFLQHRIEQQYPDITITDAAFTKVLNLFTKYSWNLNDTPGGNDDEINPNVLGYIFEKYINQKEFGAYYTRPEITEYLCDKTINKYIVNQVNSKINSQSQAEANYQFSSITELLLKLDAKLCHLLIEDILPNLSLLDPACGSGAFLVAAMKTLISVYSAVIGTIKLRGDRKLKQWLEKIENDHHSLSYFIKKRIITDNLYGVDIMEEATEIAKLRLFLALVSSAQHEDELEPLPNIDFNIMVGNSLIGLIKVDEKSFDKSGNQDILQSLKSKDYQSILQEKNASIKQYKEHAFKPTQIGETSQEYRLLSLRDHITRVNHDSMIKLNQLLLDEFSTKLGIKYEEVQLTGKPKKRVLNVQDMHDLKPFHWGYHFDQIIAKGGFDIILGNPPWEIFKPQAKEFFAEFSDIVTKNKMDIKTFEKQQKQLLQNPEVANAWLKYQSQYPHVSLYYRSAEQYINQISVVNGKKQGTDINLYKLFVEQCVNLLAKNGECGLVIPSGIYTDLGTKQLREMLFSQTNITGLFCFENRKAIFEEVHKSFKFVVLTFENGKTTEYFPAKFMRHYVEELSYFPDDETINIKVDLIKQLSPDSLSVMEFKTDLDILIAEKMSRFPLLGEEISHTWNFKLTREFDMTNDSHLFKTEPGKGRLPLYEGKIFNQFNHNWGKPKYWLDEQEASQDLLSPRSKEIANFIKKNNLCMPEKTTILLDYQSYRLAFRDVTATTNERSVIMTVLPPNVFCPHTVSLEKVYDVSYENGIVNPNSLRINSKERLFVCALVNSFLIDYFLRKSITNHVSFFYVYQTPVPRLTEKDPYFQEIVERAAKLICTTAEYDELAKEVGLGSHKNGVTAPEERAKLRAELDGIVAHLYQLTEREFRHILSTFPIVAEEVKTAAITAYQLFCKYSAISNQ